MREEVGAIDDSKSMSILTRPMQNILNNESTHQSKDIAELSDGNLTPKPNNDLRVLRTSHKL